MIASNALRATLLTISDFLESIFSAFSVDLSWFCGAIVRTDRTSSKIYEIAEVW